MSAAARRVLFATSNGTGLGHLNRAMAIARRLPADHDACFFTLSQAAPVVAREGWGVEYMPSYRLPASGSDWQWNLRLRDRLRELLAELEPDVVVFDGVHPYRALTHVLTEPGAPRSIWCRRPLWRAGSSAAPLARSTAFDAVLEPGELAAAADRGPTVARRDEVFAVDPIVFLDREELLDRASAAAELGLDPDRTTALVTLGQGGAVDRAVAAVLERLAAEPGLQVAALESSIAGGLELPAGVVRISGTFPISRSYPAFDMAVSAAGYNGFHELLAFAVPTLFVPMPRLTDDQAARARWAAEAGLALAAAGADDPRLTELVGALLDAGLRERLAASAVATAGGRNGAATAADFVAAIAAGERPAPPVRRGGRLHRWLVHSSHRVGPSLPLAAALTARDLLRHPERRPPRAIVLALAVPEGELADRLAPALDRLGELPERTFVVTDSLELSTLRAAGVGFERIPPPAEARRLGVEEGGYPAFVERRLGQILRGREPRQALSIGADPERLLERIGAGGTR